MTEIVMWESGNNKWQISKYRHHTGRVKVLVTDGYFCDYPILYDETETVAYDYPERVPQYVREQVKRIMLKMRANGTLNEYIQ